MPYIFESRFALNHRKINVESIPVDNSCCDLIPLNVRAKRPLFWTALLHPIPAKLTTFFIGRGDF